MAIHPTPVPGQGGAQRRLAVALDCEMGTAFGGERELIRLTAIDYFSGEVLIDSLVYPDVRMQHYNTRYSGVTRADMEKARRQMKCFFGRTAAREALWKFVGPETIVVGHSTQNDLASLRWIHHRVVDSFVIEAEERKKEEAAAEAKKGEQSRLGQNQPETASEKQSLSLKSLAKRKLGREIQMRGKQGHDSFEDAVASRDLVHQHVTALLARPRSED